MYIPASRHAVHWSKVEANWLHDIPLKLLKCKPHEPCCLQHQEAQSTQEFLANQDDSLFADFNLLFFHLFQLLYPWVYWIGSKHRKLGIRVWVNLATFNQRILKHFGKHMAQVHVTRWNLGLGFCSPPIVIHIEKNRETRKTHEAVFVSS